MSAQPLLVERRTGEDRRSPANRRQEGGAHYGLSELQHWDVVTIFNLDYFQGNITKYVFRHKDKKGLEDLKKAKHYLEKYMETEYGYVEPAPEAEPVLHLVDPPVAHNRFLKKAARLGALFTISVAGFAHCMDITEAEAEELLNCAKAEGGYVPPDQRKTAGTVDTEAVVERNLRTQTSPGILMNEVEGDSLCGATLTESPEFAPPVPLHEALEEEQLKRACAAWDAGKSLEQFQQEEGVTEGFARMLYARVANMDPHDEAPPAGKNCKCGPGGGPYCCQDA